ncbi:MAG: YhdP family protein, partial [Gammaproteobacteria bacterium]
LSTNNVSQMLTSWGMNASALVGSSAQATFDLSWTGAPYNPSLASMNGTLALKLGPGRIINLGNSTEAKLGLGRLLNLLSLQSIPQRLSLNFSDLTQNGYSFDSMAGDFKLQNGNAYTDNMYIDGTVASVRIAGRIGLAAKNYDMRLGINAHVTSSLPLIVGAFNPIAGVATWAVDKIVSSQASKVTMYTYRITGTWDNPNWSQIAAH